MSINISGLLSVRTVNGRNGEFNVGVLVTDIGEFSVKDAQLDQFQEGRYQGQFEITRIAVANYFAAGRLVVENRATLRNIWLNDLPAPAGDTATDGSLLAEKDPIEERAGADAGSTGSVPQPELMTNAAAKATSDIPELGEAAALQASDPDRALFGDLFPLNTTIKLDPAVDRKVFRAQRDRLRALGFEFDPALQVWNLVTTA